MSSQKDIEKAKEAGEAAGRNGYSEHRRPWEYYNGKLGDAWERAYKEAKEKAKNPSNEWNHEGYGY